MVLEFSAVEHPEDWMRVVAEQLGMPVEGTRVKLPEMLGQGFFSQYTLCEWLTLNYLGFVTHEPLMLVRRPVAASPWIPVMFYTTTGYEQIIGASSRAVGIDTLDGIFMPSCHIPTEWRIPPGVWLTNVTLTFHGERVQPLLDGDCYLARLLHSWQSFYLFETITPAMALVLANIGRCVEEQGAPFQMLALLRLSIELFGYFVERIERRAGAAQFTNLDGRDVEAIFQVRARILQDLARVPSIVELGSMVGMSPSKLQRYFRLVTGISITEFAMAERMEWAKRLLASRRYTVSEVGYTVGYTNLSHFSEIFRRYYQLNPKQFQASQME